MKKFLLVSLSVLVCLAVSVTTVFAAPNGFVSSPSSNSAPTLVESDNLSDDCVAALIITAFSDRDSLDEATRAAVEKAYNDITSSTDLTKLNADLAALVKKLGIKPANLAVSDLFDISYYNCDDHGDHKGFDIKLNADTLKNFVGLLHLKDGKWELVKDAKISADGEHLLFGVDSLSPFAIVVDTVGEVSPQTGEKSHVALALMLASASALAIVLIILKKKKV